MSAETSPSCTITSASPISRAARSVSSSGSPGPAPTRVTVAGGISAMLGRWRKPTPVSIQNALAGTKENLGRIDLIRRAAARWLNPPGGSIPHRARVDVLKADADGRARLLDLHRRDRIGAIVRRIIGAGPMIARNAHSAEGRGGGRKSTRLNS